jgi:hypothetical protein
MSGVIGGAEEAVQESIGNFLTNLNAIHWSAYDKDRDWWDGMVESGAAGGAAGFTANFLMAFVGSRGMRNIATDAPTRLRAIDDSLAELERVLSDPKTTKADEPGIRDSMETMKANRTTILEMLEDEKAKILSDLDRIEKRGGPDAVRSDRFNDLVKRLEQVDNTILDANLVDPGAPAETPVAPVKPEPIPVTKPVTPPVVDTPVEPDTEATPVVDDGVVNVTQFAVGEGGTRGVFQDESGQLYKSIQPQSLERTEKGIERVPIEGGRTKEHELLSELQGNPHVPKVGEVVQTNTGPAFKIERLEEIEQYTPKEHAEIVQILDDLNDQDYHVADKVTVMRRPATGELVVVDFSNGYKRPSAPSD